MGHTIVLGNRNILGKINITTIVFCHVFHQAIYRTFEGEKFWGSYSIKA